MPSPVLYLDMDGCPVDFVGGALQAHNRTLPYDEIRWDLPAQLGMFAKDFWNPLGRSFWANLNWTVDGLKILRGVEAIFGVNICVLTSPCETDGCIDGKRDWIKRNMPEYRRRALVGSAKSLAASPRHILLDDHEPNVDAFIKEGGQAVLLPRPWNRRRDDYKSGMTLGDVMGELREAAWRAGGCCHV